MGFVRVMCGPSLGPHSIATKRVCRYSRPRLPQHLGGGGGRQQRFVLLRSRSRATGSEMTMSERSSEVDNRGLLLILDAMMCKEGRMKMKERRWEGRKYVGASGDEVVSWLLVHGHAKSASEATALGRDLVRIGGLVPMQRVEAAAHIFVARADMYYAHHALSSAGSKNGAGGLNSYTLTPLFSKARGVFDVLRDLSAAWGRLLPDVVMRGGLEMRYDMVAIHEEWGSLLLALAELAHCAAQPGVSDDVKKATLYNAYNVLIVHAKLVHGHPRNILVRGPFFDNAAYIFAGIRLSSTELEHGVLRLKMVDSHPLAWLRPSTKDARMHFALNCGAQSCPPLRAWDPNNVEAELSTATTSFISTNAKVDEMRNCVTLSRLWKWFRNDFTPGTTDDKVLLKWISERAPLNIREQLDALTATAAPNPKLTLKFAVYNWGDNGDYGTSDTNFMSLYDISFKRNE